MSPRQQNPTIPTFTPCCPPLRMKRGQRDRALIEIRRALELDPNRGTFHADLALLQANDSTNTSSVEDKLKKAMALDPKSVDAKLMLAEFLCKE